MEKDSEYTHIRINKDLKYKVKIAAAKLDTSIQEWVETALKTKLKEK